MRSIKENILGNGHGPDIKWITLDSKQPLMPESVNIAVFGSKEARQIQGIDSFTPQGEETKGIKTKPPLKLSLDVLILFNLKDYESAFLCYVQVIGFLYNHNTFTMRYNGAEYSLSILPSQFLDRDEIDIWSAFHVPGIPILRYEIKYVLISGDIKVLPMVKSTAVDSTVSEDDILPVSVIYTIKEPIINELNSLIQNIEKIHQEWGVLGILEGMRKRKLIKHYNEVQKEIYSILTLHWGYIFLFSLINRVLTEQRNKIKESRGLDKEVLHGFIKSLEYVKTLFCKHIITGTSYVNVCSPFNDRISLLHHQEMTMTELSKSDMMIPSQYILKAWQMNDMMIKLKKTLVQIIDGQVFESESFWKQAGSKLIERLSWIEDRFSNKLKELQKVYSLQQRKEKIIYQIREFDKVSQETVKQVTALSENVKPTNDKEFEEIIYGSDKNLLGLLTHFIHKTISL
ncbi:hypothetical protein [Aureibacter tunicatorum]|uniref:Uncharacterized protein n=1 Tax=Aureibacter tunicatorum TaxID=866807 RepID=A0AAE3XP52_9BACT|nr:hypothetical protein [Aureibacter tunicatorum]MDR6240037.1 hypothetical protein [Aureibacter tunicatorum]